MKKGMTLMSWLLICIWTITFSMPAVQAEDVALQNPAANQVKIGIAFTNDVHARVEGTTTKDGNIDSIGMSRFKTIVDSIRAGKDISLVLDGGDLFHGQSIATLVNGESVAEVAKAVGYDAMVSGNHDWNYGKSQLMTLQSMAGLNILAGNIINTADGSAFFGQNDYLIKSVSTMNGFIIRVGVFGVIDPQIYASTNPANVEGLAFTDMAEYANHAVAYLKDKEQCDVVIGLAHCVDPKGLASQVNDVNLWLSGHEHVVMNEEVQTPDGDRTSVIQTGMYMQNIGDIEITLPEDYQSLSKEEQETQLNLTSEIIDGTKAEAYEEDAAVQKVLTDIQEQQKPILENKVGESPAALDWSWESVRINELSIGNVLTDAYMKETGADVAIENAGGIRAAIPQGDVSYGDIISVLPYGNYLVTKELTGAQLRSVMETSIDIMLNNRAANDSGDYNAWPGNSGSALQIGGMKVTYRANNAKGARILALTIGGADADDTKTYKVAMNNFLAANADDYPEIAANPIINEYAACDEAVIRYFASEDITNSVTIDRITANNTILTDGKTPEEIVSQMTLEQKIGQMIMPAFRTYNQTNVTEMNDTIRAAVEKYGFGGVILFAENTQGTEQTARLVSAFQDAALSETSNTQIPLMVAIDQEGGSVARLQTGSSLCSNMTLGAARSTDLAASSATIIGSELSALGINVDFAPDMDINNNPSNPVIGIRSFSSNADLVSKLGTAFIDGLHSQNVATALKHFPGHGDTGTDSHTGLPQINKTYEQLKQCELIPFQSGITAGTDIVMTAHIQYPQIESTTYTSLKGGEVYLPATLSKTMITDVLRGDMGYDGVVSTDAMEMRAIADNFNQTDTATLAINADVDILLMPTSTSTAAEIDSMESYIDAIVSQVASGAIDEDTITKSATRIIQLKQKRGILNTTIGNVDEKVAAAKTVVGSKAHHDEEWRITQKGMTLIKNENSTLPLQVKSGEKVALFCSYEDEVTEMQFAVDRLKSEGILPQDAVCEINFYNGKSASAFEALIKESSHILATVETYRLTNMDPADVNAGWQSLFLDELIDASHAAGKKIAVLSTHLPYDLARYHKADALLAAYNAKAMSVIPTEYNGETVTYGPNVPVAVCMAFGEGEPTGVLPVDIMKLDAKYQYTDQVLYPYGYGLMKWGKSEDSQKDPQKDPQKETKKKPGVATGDETNVMLFLIAGFVSFGVIAAMRQKRR